jgi:hypothetical protein
MEKPAIVVTSALAIGGLVDITDHEIDGRCFARYVVRVSIQVEPTGSDYITKLSPVEEEPGKYYPKYVEGGKHVILHATRCDDEQKWCIY